MPFQIISPPISGKSSIVQGEPPRVQANWIEQRTRMLAGGSLSLHSWAYGGRWGRVCWVCSCDWNQVPIATGSQAWLCFLLVEQAVSFLLRTDLPLSTYEGTSYSRSGLPVSCVAREKVNWETKRESICSASFFCNKNRKWHVKQEEWVGLPRQSSVFLALGSLYRSWKRLSFCLCRYIFWYWSSQKLKLKLKTLINSLKDLNKPITC